MKKSNNKKQTVNNSKNNQRNSKNSNPVIKVVVFVTISGVVVTDPLEYDFE